MPLAEISSESDDSTRPISCSSFENSRRSDVLVGGVDKASSSHTEASLSFKVLPSRGPNAVISVMISSR